MAPVSRRSVLRGLLATSVGGAASALSGCGALTGFATTGGSGMTFFSTQFAPVEEVERFRDILRSSVDGEVSYDQFLDWASAARRANGGRPVLALPGGPKRPLHRFTQGFPLPSFTSGQITTFRSRESVEAWEYFRELWRNTVPTSTTYDFIQEPLASGEASIGWDHVARLTNAPQADPSEWFMAPSPRGPAGLGYLVVLLGVGIPRGAPDADFAQQVTGVGTREGEVSKVFKDCFQSIVLDGADIRSTLDSQSKVMNGLLADLEAPCWVPDPSSDGRPCEVA